MINYIDEVMFATSSVYACVTRSFTGWWFQIFFLCSPLFGEDSQFDYIIFFKGVETTNCSLSLSLYVP